MKVYLKRVTLAVIVFIAFSQVVQAQDLTKKFGEDSISCLEHLSLYREVFKQNNYKEAYTSWKWVVDNCPMSSMFIFVNGPVILEELIKNEKDSVRREAYIQELFDLFYLRIKCYPPDEGFTLGRIGIYTIKYRQRDYKKALECMEKSIELEGSKTSPQVLDIYFQTSEMYMKNEKLTTETLIEAYDKITEVLDATIDEGEIKLEKVMREIYLLQENLDSGLITQDEFLATYNDRKSDSTKAANELLQLRNVNNNMNVRFAKHATCDILISIYSKKFEASKDLRTLQQIVKFFTKENCTDNALFIAAVEELYKLAPNANIAFSMGRIKLGKKEYNDAISYLNQALEMFEKESDKIKTYLLLAECYSQLGQYSTARETAYKILKLNPNDGRVYIFVGNMYMMKANTCASEVPGAAYWAAADKFSKAKTVDHSISEEADKLLRTAASRFPKIGVYFNYGLNAGDTYKVDCWIGETTTVR